MSTAGLPRVRQRTVLAMLCMALTSTLALAQDFDEHEGAGVDDPALLDAEIMPQAAHSLLLDVIRAGDGFVAVGERGHVLHSSDGVEWRQAKRVPSRSTLTAVTHHDGLFWAVGHDGVILHASDAGGAWERQRAAPLVPGGFDPEAGVPLLDVVFLDPRHGLAVGAFSLLLETHDGGENWVPRFLSEEAEAADDGAAEGLPAPAAANDLIDDDDDWGFSAEDLMLDAEDDPHLNSITRAGGGGLMIAGERGTLFRSRDDGASWERLALPYEGSMFGVLAWEDEHVMVLGLRGNVFESFDLGSTWRRVDTGTEASMMGGVALPGGGALLVGNEGRMLWRSAQDEPFRRLTHTNEEGETPVLATAVAAGDGRFILVGERGADRTAPLE